MQLELDESHDPTRRSWVESASAYGSQFPIQNLPFGIFRAAGVSGDPRGGIAIGDLILDVGSVAHMLDDTVRPVASLLAASTLQPFMRLDPQAWTALRRAIGHLLAAGHIGQQDTAKYLHPMAHAELFLPARPGGFVDFFASIQHATNAGSIFRPDAPLLPNYKYVPIAYNGRVSTIGVSGTPVRRPCGQRRLAEQQAPTFGPTQRLDFEMELGVFMGGHSAVGTTVPVSQAWRHIFGFCLLNDWSARDIQSWEYQPLGPFLGKSFATTISPWVISADAMRPFRSAMRARPERDPAPLPHLFDAADQATGALDIVLETRLKTAKQKRPGEVLGRASARGLYWSVGQMVAHQTSNGCNIEPGDLFGTGTISGDEPGTLGSLLEMTRAGAKRISLSGGENRTFLEDGDEVEMRAVCTREGFASIGFGSCVGEITPATAG